MSVTTPPRRRELASLVEAPATTANWNGPYVKKREMLKDPWGHPYNYLIPGAAR